MKTVKIIKTLFVLLLTGAGMGSCTGNFEEINTNPNRMLVGDITSYGMFEPILYNSSNRWQEYTWFWNNELIQFTAHTGGTTRNEHRYVISAANWQSVWNQYADFANNTIHMYDLAIEHNEPAMQAIALTFKALFLSNQSDMFGDIPYSEAFTGRKPDGTKTPKFDSQKEVYQQLFADLERANEIYSITPTPIFQKQGITAQESAAMDGMYGGRLEQWQKFNNSLYLRLLCRVSGRAEMNVGAKLSEILNNPAKYPVFASNDDNAKVVFSGIEPYLNYFYEHTQGEFSSSSRKLTEQLIKMTVLTDEVTGDQVYTDPRLPIYGQRNTNSANPRWKGTVAGCTEGERSIVDGGTSWLNYAVFCRRAAPNYYMDYAEVLFVWAEAALKGLIPGGESKAKEYYEEAITASVQKWSEYGALSQIPVTITDLDVQAFLNSDLAAWDKAGNKEELIGNQKFLALFWTGMEAYHEYRRTGYPTLTIGQGTEANEFTLPTRFAYPPITMATNAASAQEAVSRMGGNDMKTPVWWSKEAIQKGR
ncbi:MAG: SusD/RagB family nutrient-binding outer membrane lipoprotein [Prevotellaceae bacterium]|jgi:hypothetical protein|nr:SusD/RagB family nutrient-binding outer membrane lipoprotein [Prevotellaceae bacterium]